MPCGRGPGLIEGGAEFEDAGADGFDRNGERQGGGFVDEKDDAVEFAFAGTARQGEAQGMEKITTAEFEFFLELRDHFLETIGGKGRGL